MMDSLTPIAMGAKVLHQLGALTYSKTEKFDWEVDVS
jgi:hypothetical protein